jgi:hypothetical protein
MEADGYVDKSLRTLKGMARRFYRPNIVFELTLAGCKPINSLLAGSSLYWL